ncbi:MAG: hypothetical protein AAF989_00845 [Planctomycetota bacterium]
MVICDRDSSDAKELLSRRPGIQLERNQFHDKEAAMLDDRLGRIPAERDLRL